MEAHMRIQQVIKERSYFIWEGEGRPHGRHLDHWLMAEAEVRGEGEVAPRAERAMSPAKAAPKSAAKPALKSAPAKPAPSPAKKPGPRKG
jgi:hypothetical protein